MNNYHKWTIKDGDYIRDEANISIARPENLVKRFKGFAFSILWKVALITLATIIFIKMI
ncbi:MAG: hypothetical protein GW805_03805 [Ignavibacteria bacterium]|nr:hypothetical protein [Ignavibacteria bacterium]NCS81634.1 hypothetical protein [Ignavibacteria bacterium]